MISSYGIILCCNKKKLCFLFQISFSQLYPDHHMFVTRKHLYIKVDAYSF